MLERKCKKCNGTGKRILEIGDWVRTEDRDKTFKIIGTHRIKGVDKLFSLIESTYSDCNQYPNRIIEKIIVDPDDISHA